MADKGGAKAGAAGGEEGKEGEDKEPEKGCCDKYAECLVVTGKVHYRFNNSGCIFLLFSNMYMHTRMFSIHMVPMQRKMLWMS